MSAIRFIVILLLAGILCIPPFVAGGDETGATGARGEYVQKIPVSVMLSGSGSSYSNSSFKFTLPSGSTIQSASVDLEGLPATGPTESATCDFSQPDAASYLAYKGQYAQNNPGNAAPSTFTAAQFAAYEMSNIKSSDNKYTVNSISTNYMWYNYQHYKFKVSFDAISKVSVTWKGYAGETFAGIGTATTYIWNDTGKGWETVGTGSQTPDSTLTNDFFGPGYVDAEGYLYVIAFCTVGVNFYGEILNSIATDFVQAVVDGHSVVYPKNPSMDIGINNQPEWSVTADRFDYKVTVNNAAVKYEIQDAVKNGKTQYSDVKVKFSSETEGAIRVSDFTVAYNAPPWCNGIPDTLAFDEDTDGTRLLDLNGFFNDPDDGDVPKLKYEVSYEEDSSKLAATIDPDGHSVDFAAAPDWWGVLAFRVKATDKSGLSRESSTFKVTVRSVNDPPVLNPIPDQTATEDIPWSVQVAASDVDVALDPSEEILFEDNTSLFSIDKFTGNATFTPTQDQVGIWHIQILATDFQGVVASQNFTLDIKDAEDPPLLLAVPVLNATVGQPFSYTPVADDPDLPYGDSLIFSDDSPLFQIDPKSGLISFTPSMSDIGTHSVSITVTDSRGGSDTKQITLRILNSIGTMDRPPAISPISNQTINAGVLFEYIAMATDPDLGSGDVLNFSDDSPLFVISLRGKISFTPQNKDAGVHHINLTVTDREGLSATTGFMLTIVGVNRPPVIESISPPNGTKVKLNERVNFKVTATDPDGDFLSVTWKYKDKVLGYSTGYQMAFDKTGPQTMVVVVSDGQTQLYREISVEVEKPKPAAGPAGGSGINMSGIVILLIVIIVVISAVIIVSRRKPGFLHK